MNRRVWMMCAGLSFFPMIQAAFVPIEDFEGLTTGGINGQGGWVSTGETVVLDPLDATNQVLQLGNAGSETSLALNVSDRIQDASLATLFFRFQIVSDKTNSHSFFGLSDVTTPGANNFDDFEVQTGFSTGVGATNGDLVIRDGGDTFTGEQQSFSAGSWYSAFVVVDTTLDSWSMYVEGQGFASQTQLTFDSGSTDALFRNPASTNPLVSLYFRNGANTNSGGEVLIDDLQIDLAGENLVSPVPEPGTLALVGLVGGLFLFFRKRS